MNRQIYVNLPVKDLDITMKFYSALGFSFNEQFTDEKAACMVVSDNIFVMLLREEFFKTFTKKEIADATKNTEAILAISAESREEVDIVLNKALAAGGTSPMPSQDHGWMYGRGFTDPDGHMWEIIYMDPAGPADN
ncbi:MAG: VOC family protein [Chitinophagales bacterium]|nr:VOC family protein [Chitinophagales bacterium]